MHQVSQKMGGIAESVANGSEVVVQKLALSSSATANSIKVLPCIAERVPLALLLAVLCCSLLLSSNKGSTQ